MSEGLHEKYRVEKIDDPGGKHDECRYFVLDPQHDPIARIALRAYADEAWNTGNRALGDELTEWAHECERTPLTGDEEYPDDRCPEHGPYCSGRTCCCRDKHRPSSLPSAPEDA